MIWLVTMQFVHLVTQHTVPSKPQVLTTNVQVILIRIDSNTNSYIRIVNLANLHCFYGSLNEPMILLPAAMEKTYSSLQKYKPTMQYTCILVVTDKAPALPLLLLDDVHISVNMELYSYTKHTSVQFTNYTQEE